MTTRLSQFTARLADLVHSERSAGFGNSTSHPREEEDRFSDLALDLFDAQFQTLEPYRRFCLHRGQTPDTVRSWQEIPAVPAESFKEVDWSHLDPADRVREFRSSGTTAGQSSRHCHSRASLALYERVLLHGFQSRYGLRPHDRHHFLILTPPSEQAPHSSLAHMFDTIHRTHGTPESAFFGAADSEGAWRLDVERLEQALHRAASYSAPVAVLGTAFSYVHLIDHLRRTSSGFSLPPRSFALETGGYKGRSRILAKTDLYRGIRDCLGLPLTRVVAEYGMSELSSQAYDLPADEATPVEDRVFAFASSARALVVSPETGRPVHCGEAGLIRIVDLANVWSVASIQTEDLAVREPAGFRLLGRATTATPRGCSLMPSTTLHSRSTVSSHANRPTRD